METNKTESTFSRLSKIFEISSEQSIDTDFTLPDYYPEVSKVIKCMTEVSVLSCQSKDGAVSVGGQTVITLLYADNDNEINSFIHICPFMKTVDINADCTESFLEAVPRINYINSKAIAPRKLEVHGSFTISLVASLLKHEKIVENIDCECLYTKTVGCKSIEPQQPISKCILIEDDISIGQNKPSVGKILRSSAKASISECKFVSGKTVVKGDIEVCVLYCPTQSGRPILLTEQRGFSQIIDSDCSEECCCDVYAKVMSLELHPKTSLDGEVKNIAFEVKVNIDIYPYSLVERKAICDVISGKYKTDASKITLPVECLADSIKENFVCKKNLDFGGGLLNDIFDLWCTSNIDFVSAEENCILMKGTVIVNTIGRNIDSQPVFYERTIDFEYRYDSDDIGENIIRCKPNIEVVAVNYSINTESVVDVAVELSIKGNVFLQKEITVVSKISLDADNLINKDTDAAVVLYFAENETVWDIAKKYCSSPQKICEVNGVEDFETTCNKIMLIPNI